MAAGAKPFADPQAARSAAPGAAATPVEGVAQAGAMAAKPAAVSAASAATSAVNAAAGAATAILKLEAELRKLRTETELLYFVANELRHVTRAQQVFVFTRAGSGRMTASAVSAVTNVDRAAPLVIWVEGLVATLGARHGLAEARDFEAGAFDIGVDAEGVTVGYPLRQLVWVPFLDLDGAPIGGMLMARTTPWTGGEMVVAGHLAGAVSHASLAMAGRHRGLASRLRFGRRSAYIGAAVILALAFVPVSMTALAPAEVAARDPFIVTVGVDGVVDKVLVKPNQRVESGQPLVQLADTVLRNRLEVADREVVVAEARQKKASQLAFVDIRGRHELALAQAELEVKIAERDYAREMFARAVVKAERPGVAVFGDSRDIVGRPVAVGEKLMEIADPEAAEIRIDLPVADAIVLSEAARVKVFLDSDPLRPVETRLVRADYQARVQPGQQLAFRLVADGAVLAGRGVRLGVRGTAQIYSSSVPLGYYLLRRPITALRQWIGA